MPERPNLPTAALVRAAADRWRADGGTLAAVGSKPGLPARGADVPTAPFTR